MRVVLALVVLAVLLAPAAWAAESSLTLISEPGDFIGQGRETYYAAGDGVFSAGLYFYPHKNAVEVDFRTPSFDHYFYLYFSAGPHDLAPGLYDGATTWPGHNGGPGFMIFGDGRGCGTYTGKFLIKEFTTDAANNVTSFWATFEQHCEGGAPALRGDVRFQAEPEPLDFYTLTPCRVLDTRAASDGPALAPGERRIVAVAGTCGVPASAKAIAANATVVAPASDGFLTLFAGNLTPPATSVLNLKPGRFRANNAVLVLASDGSGTVAVQNSSAGASNLLLDVSGYFQ